MGGGAVPSLQDERTLKPMSISDQEAAARIVALPG